MSRLTAFLSAGILMLCSPARGQAGNQQDDASKADPFSLILLMEINKVQEDRLLHLTLAEFKTAVGTLEANPEGPIAMRYVWVAAKNFNRLASELPADLKDRAAAALVKETDIEDKNLRLQNLHNLEGVNHPLLKALAEKLSSSEHEYTARQAKKNLEILNLPTAQANPATPGSPGTHAPTAAGNGVSTPAATQGGPSPTPPTTQGTSDGTPASGKDAAPSLADAPVAVTSEEPLVKPWQIIVGLAVLLAGFFLGKRSLARQGPH